MADRCKPAKLGDFLTSGLPPLVGAPTDMLGGAQPTFEEQVRDHLARCGVPDRFLGHSFGDFTERTGTKLALKAARDVAEAGDKGLVLTGRVGSGKTHLAVAIVRRRIELWLERWPEAFARKEIHGHWYTSPRPPLDIRFEVVPSLLDRVRMAIAGPENADPLAASRAAKLLILDDLGREKPTDWVVERLYVLVNDRYNAQKPTIVTTNLTAAELIERGYDALYSRLIEGVERVGLRTTDHRQGGS